jgi:DNA-3-methyladenine glycosylase II
LSEKAIKFLKRDPKIAEIIHKVGKYEISLVKNPYRSLIDAIITQQLSGAAADSISKKFQRLYQDTQDLQMSLALLIPNFDQPDCPK